MAPKVNELKPNEVAILVNAWRCIEGTDPKVDLHKLAGMCGYTNDRSASNILSAAKKKVRSVADTNAVESAAATPPKRNKRSVAEVVGPSSEDSEANKTPGPAKRFCKAHVEDDHDEEEI
ncbi:hypothetical protein F4808DRAFT_464260 [Astrocystis sublimbata]|nr:hypothetical protein F4808DRAFT_464260 [Astrocystis sublimbata]